MSRWFKTFCVILPCLSLILPATASLAFDDEGPTIEAAKTPKTAKAADKIKSTKKPSPPTVPYDKAANPGVGMLDQAMATRLNAEQLSDLAVIVSYCEKALELGLDEFHTDLAKAMLTTTLTQRAQFAAKAAFRPGQGQRNWSALREIALRDLKKAILHMPNNSEALLLLTDLNLLPGGDKKAALKALDQVLKIDGIEPKKYSKAITLRADLEEDLPQKQAFLDRALAKNPDNLDALRLRGLLLMTKGMSKEAKVDLQRAMKLDESDADTCELLATVLLDLAEFDAAEKMVKKLQKLSPDSAIPFTLSAQLHAAKKELPAALDDLNHALELEPTNAGVLLLRAYLYYEMKLPDQALADVEKVLKIRPQFNQARRFQLALLAEQGDLDKILKELKRLRKEQPGDPELILQLAMLHAMKKEPLKAIKLYTELIDKDAKNTDALRGRAGTFLGIGKQAEAIADFNQALTLVPDESDMLNNLAWVLATSPDAKLRDGKRAIKLATKACKITGFKQAHILSTLAAAYAETDNFKRAIELSNQAVELSKELTDPEVKAALQKELKSYQEKKPWRELLEDGLPTTE